MNLGQFDGLIIGGRVEIDTVTTVSAVNHFCSHVLLASRVLKLAHTSPLPGVFLSIGEENILTLDVEAAVIFVGTCGKVVR